MKPLASLAIVLGLSCFAPIHIARAAQNADVAAEKQAESGAKEEKEPSMVWLTANFLILAGALGYLIAKKAPAFFDARSKKIDQDIAEAKQFRIDADARAAEIERRLAALDTDIAALKTTAQAQIDAESERLTQQIAAEIQKIEEHTRQEIESAGKAARMELKRYAADLAIQLAETKMRARMTPDTQDGLVRSFVRGLEPPKPEAKGN